MHKTLSFGSLLLTIVLCVYSCGIGTAKKNLVLQEETSRLSFDADSAYFYVERQTSFGPRVPGTEAHADCRIFLIEKMNSFGMHVTEQNCRLTSWDGTKLNATNIIASFQQDNKKRILLCAHWDSRPWADQDPNPENWKTPIEGANDGASGVGVLMELARQLQLESEKGRNPSYGVDFLFFDAEDRGTPKFAEIKENEDSWCLGTQYWAKEARKSGYRAEFGILLDMVGGQAPTFMWDYYSNQYAPQILQKVWSKAAELGYNAFFVASQGGSITDDHLYVNRLAGIPCIDIIDYDPGSPTGFVPYWHTLDDTMKNIDRNSLKAVGETLLNVLFNP
jgi:hypothetical protein